MLKIIDTKDFLDKIVDYEKEYDFVTVKQFCRDTGELNEINLDRKFDNVGHSMQLMFEKNTQNHFLLKEQSPVNFDLLYDLIDGYLIDKINYSKEVEEQ